MKTWVEVFVYLGGLCGSFDLFLLSKGKGCYFLFNLSPIVVLHLHMFMLYKPDFVLLLIFHHFWRLRFRGPFSPSPPSLSQKPSNDAAAEEAWPLLAVDITSLAPQVQKAT